MQVEKDLMQTKKLLEVILQHRFPVFISTKSTLIKRDIELLKEIDKTAILPADFPADFHHGVILAFSLSTLDEKIAKQIEPGASSPLERLETLQVCKEHGLFVGVNAIPLLPFISDTDEELENMIKTSKQYAADFILAGGLTLFGDGPADGKTLYYRFLQKNYPALTGKYDKMFDNNYYQPRQYHKNLEKKVQQYCYKYQLRNSIL